MEFGNEARELACETSVLELMVEGLGKKQIADRLDLNQHTTDYVMRCIYRKLHVNGMTADVSVAFKERLVLPYETVKSIPWCLGLEGDAPSAPSQQRGPRRSAALHFSNCFTVFLRP